MFASVTRYIVLMLALLVAPGLLAQERIVSVGFGQAFLPTGDLVAVTMSLAADHPVRHGLSVGVRAEGLYTADLSEVALFETGDYHARRHLGLSVVAKQRLVRFERGGLTHHLGIHAGGAFRYHDDEAFESLVNVTTEEDAAFYLDDLARFWPGRAVRVREVYDADLDQTVTTFAATGESRGIRLGALVGIHYAVEYGRLRFGLTAEVQQFEHDSAFSDLDALLLRPTVGYTF
ncbi:MAG: hypothetical protein AAF809_12350 [Bacteroidota bacterium]